MAAGCGYIDAGRWKHEEPLELESELEIDTELKSLSPTFSILSVPRRLLPPKLRWLKSDDEKRRIAERRVIWEWERNASQLYY